MATIPNPMLWARLDGKTVVEVTPNEATATDPDTGDPLEGWVEVTDKRPKLKAGEVWGPYTYKVGRGGKVSVTCGKATWEELADLGLGG
jgi:hypothetical protein